MSSFKFDPSQPMLRKTLREYEEKALRYLWETGEEGAKSLLIWKAVNERLNPDGSISRAAIIVAMNRLVDHGVLGFREGTGKGGYHRIYYPLMDEKGYKKYIIKMMVESLLRDFPEETKDVLNEFSH
jgi:predicted transcriptional regulator